MPRSDTDGGPASPRVATASGPRVGRRAFLRAAAGGAATLGLSTQLGWLTACTERRSAAEQVRGADWDALARGLKGQLIRPGDPSYARVAPPFNLRYAQTQPAGIAIVRDAADVRHAMVWARDNDVLTVARSGGHSYAGYSTTSGLVIDLGRWRDAAIDAEAGTLTATPGARNTDVYRTCQPYGAVISAGRCPSVAVGGLTLGGGFGFSARHLGLTSDALVGAEVVTVDGDLVTASADEHPDLFWALRGGGGGNFGIATRYRFRTHPVGDVSIYDLAWRWEDAPAVLAAFQDVVLDAPAAFSGRIGGGASGSPPGPGWAGASLSVLGQYFGPSHELRELLQPLLKAAAPISQMIEDRTFWQAKSYFFHTVPTGSFQEKSSYVTEPLSHEGIEALIEPIERWPGSGNRDGGGFALFAWGGKMAEPAPEATAFVHRDGLFLLAYETTWSERDRPAVVDAGLAWLESYFEGMQPFVAPRSYQNFIDPSLPDWRRAYYGENLERLVEVKRAWDPEDVLRFPQGIPTSL